MDTAAEDAVIGSNAMNRLRGSLRAMGLQAVPATGVKLPGAGGIGGAAVVQSSCGAIDDGCTDWRCWP